MRVFVTGATGFVGNAVIKALRKRDNIVDDQPIRLRDLINDFTDAMGVKRVGSMSPWLLKLFIGGPLVESLITSFRIKNEKANRELGWQPHYSTFADGLPSTLKALQPE